MLLVSCFQAKAKLWSQKLFRTQTLRVRMWTRAFVFLIATVYFYQGISGEIYIAELTVESNVTLEASTILSSWSAGLQITANGQTVTLNSTEVTAECLVIGEDYNCNCSSGYVWSNKACYDYGCCNDSACLKNVSLVSPLCVPSVNVSINGTAVLTSAVTDTHKATLQSTFQQLNGVINITIPTIRSSPTIANNIVDFWAYANVKFDTTKLQDIVAGLKTALAADYIFVDTHGMVTINAPQNTVDYKSNQNLWCLFDEITDRGGWNLSKPNERFELNNGRQITLSSCISDYPSCVNVTLNGMTGILAGTYECGFTKDLVRHTASAALDVALLPDVISMAINPLIADCSNASTKYVNINVKATIPKSTETYDIAWLYNNALIASDKIKANETYRNTTVQVQCLSKSNSVKISFKNRNNNTANATIDIPMLTAGDPFCKSEYADEVPWPKTPAGVTLVTNLCPVGRVGQKQRTCTNSSVWLAVLSNCVSEEINKVSTAAGNFLQGVGATQEVALDIFEGMRNNSEPANNSANIADIMASVDIIDTMAQATQYVTLDEQVFPNFVTSASNMLNSNWSGVNETILYNMSSKYIKSMEVLVKEIQINESSGYNTTNLELQFCSGDDCNLTIFDIGVNLNKTNGLMKVMGVKNLMNKLENNFENMDRTDLILSATLVNNSDSNITISLLFPAQQDNSSEPLCVFWNTNSSKWSNEGCVANKTGNFTLCECTHLTSFSVLMSKSTQSEPALDIITTIGVAVSICCLILFLLIEWMVWSAVIKTHLSHFRHTAMVNMSVFLLLGDCSLLASSNPTNLSSTMCLTLTLCKHLFFLAMFAWMLCLSILLVHQLIFVFSPLRKRVFMYLSSILGYLCPMVLVGCSYVYYNYTGTDYHDRKTCWLIYNGLLKGSIYSFILPVGTIVLANIFSMVVVIVTLVKTSVPDSSKASEKETAKGILKAVVLLTPVFGATWGFGFGLLILDPLSILFKICNYLFTIFNAFQGLFIFLVGCFGEQKVREELLRILKVKSGQNDSLSKSTSTAVTKTK